MSPRLLLAVMIPFLTVLEAGAESFRSWAARGVREEREKDPKAAFTSYSNALSSWNPDDGGKAKAKVLCARAGLRENDGDDAGAVADLTDCLALDKKNSKGFHRRGALLLKRGKTSEAIGDLYRAVALNIGFAEAYNDRARAYESQGEATFAREDYRRACGLGWKAACASVKPLAPKASIEKAAPRAKPAKTGPAHVQIGGAKVMKTSAGPLAYRPNFKDCRRRLEACLENGDSFGTCVRKAPACGAKEIKGCCPAACLKAYQAALNSRSEAAAYREHFAPASSCAAPPKTAE